MNLCQIVCHTGLLAALVMSAFTVQAMEQLDDQQMAASTGQDGLTIGIRLPSSTFSYSQIGIVNVTDRSNPSSPRASLVMAPTTYSPTQGVQFFRNTTNDTTTAGNPVLQPFTIKIDSDRNAADPMLNVSVGLPTDLEQIRVNPFSVYIANGSGSIFTPTGRPVSGVSTLRAGVTEMLRVGTVDLQFKAGDPVRFNIQLGAERQGHMLLFTGGSLMQFLNNTPIEVVSTNGAQQSSLRLNLDIRASDQTASSLGFRLAGFYADVSDKGIIIGKDGWTDKLDIKVNNIVAGTEGVSSATAFNGLKNGSMGNIGLEGLRVENLKVSVSGM